MKPRVFSSALSAAERRVYGIVALIFIGTFFATLWPLYPRFSRIRPLLLGVPFSLFYLLILVFVSFGSMLWLYRWEERRGKHHDE